MKSRVTKNAKNERQVEYFWILLISLSYGKLGVNRGKLTVVQNHMGNLGNLGKNWENSGISGVTKNIKIFFRGNGAQRGAAGLSGAERGVANSGAERGGCPILKNDVTTTHHPVVNYD